MDTTLEAWKRDRLTYLAKRKQRETLMHAATFTPGDWAALRELIGDGPDYENGLRSEAIGCGYTQNDIELAIVRKLARLPAIKHGEAEYVQPYTLGLEVGVLRELCKRRAPRREQSNPLFENQAQGEQAQWH